MGPTDATDMTEIERYPTPETADPHDRFEVTANGEPVFVESLGATDADVYYEFPGAAELSYGVAGFALEDAGGTVTVTVDVAGDAIDPGAVRLRPRATAPEPAIDGDRISVDVEGPRKLVLEAGSDWLFLFVDPPRPDPPDAAAPDVVDVREFGVDRSGGELATKGLQEAIIDAATGPHPDGTVYVPPGVYRTGTLELYGGVTLFLDSGTVLQASPDPADFPLPFGTDHGPPGRDLGHDYALLRIHGCDGAAVVGRGVIDGAGTANGRLKLVHVEGSRGVRLRGITVRNGHGWMVPILDSEEILVENVKLVGPVTANTDGFGPDSCEGVTIRDCIVCTGDDPAVVKATNFGCRLRETVRDVTVEGCVLLTLKSALKIGTETRAERMTDVTFRDVDVLTSDRAFTVYLRDGAAIRGVTFENIRVERPGGLRADRDRLIDVSIEPRSRDVVWQHPDPAEVRDAPGTIRGLTFSGIRVDTADAEHLGSSEIAGHDRENDVSDVIFEDVAVDGEPVLDPGFELLVDDELVPFLRIDESTVQDVTFTSNR